MEYEGVFTEEDAENDGEIKRYVGKQCSQVAAKGTGELYDMFLQVCEDKGLEPWEVIGDHVVRALNDEAHAQRLSGVDVNMSALKRGNMRIEDAQFIKDFAEALGIGLDDQDSGSELDEIFKQRLKSQLQSPLAGISQEGGGRNGKPTNEEIQMLRREIQELKNQGGNQGMSPSAEEPSDEDEIEKVDEAFDKALGVAEEDDNSEADQEDVDKALGEGTDDDEGGDNDGGSVFGAEIAGEPEETSGESTETNGVVSSKDGELEEKEE
jgi:hypothetical protein